MKLLLANRLAGWLALNILPPHHQQKGIPQVISATVGKG
jgi:hypothetical protein